MSIRAYHPCIFAVLVGCGEVGDELACDYAVCPIVDESCIARVAEAVACHLEQEVVYPKVRFPTAAEYLAELEAAETAQTAAEQRDDEDFLRVQALVGLMPAGYSASAINADYLRNVAALYSPDDKDIVIIADHNGDDPMDDYLVLVHEMVHAHQDAAWDLNALEAEHGTTFDRFLGLRGLVEGDAVVYQYLAYAEIEGNRPAELDWGGFFAGWQRYSLEQASTSETPDLDTLILFPYPYGGGFVFHAWQEGRERITELSQRPPDSTRQVMRGYAGWPDGWTNDDAALDPHAVAVMPPNYTAINGGHTGIWEINAMLQRTARTGLFTPELFDVSADYLLGWRWNDAEVVAMWRIQTDTRDDLVTILTGDASQWQPPGAPTTHLVTTVGDDVLLIAVSDGDANTVLADIGGWQSIDEAVMAGALGEVKGPVPRISRALGCAPPSPGRLLARAPGT